MAKQKAGDGKCPVCNERIVWRLSDSGAVSCFCQDCDFQGYAKDGTESKRLILAGIGHTPETKPAPEAKPTPAAAPVAKGGLFGGLGL